jgi:hypothetical protein
VLVGWLLWLAGTAWASGTIVLSSDRPVVFTVNGLPHPVTDDDVPVTTNDKTGVVQVQVVNLLGQVQWRGPVEVPDGYQVRVRWIDRGLQVYGQVKIGERPLATPQATLLPIPPGNLDGPGDFTGSIVAPPVVDDGGSEATTVPATQAGVPVTLALVNRTSSWTNVTIDGVRYEFREARAQTIELTTGPHEVQVGDAQGTEVWHEGTLTITAGGSAELQFSRSQPPLLLGAPDAWSAR